jgi:hypothetical protein
VLAYAALPVIYLVLVAVFHVTHIVSWCWRGLNVVWDVDVAGSNPVTPTIFTGVGPDMGDDSLCVFYRRARQRLRGCKMSNHVDQRGCFRG